MTAMKTPGVYIVEKDEFPNSVVEVATAVPVFIGYTEKAIDGTMSLLNKPKRITSMGEFHNFFGGAPLLQFGVYDERPEDGAGGFLEAKLSDKATYYISVPPLYNLYYHMLLFYANGGGTCYIVSAGGYDYAEFPERKALSNGINNLLKEQEPTLLVIPEAVNLKSADECYMLQQDMLNHCGNVMKNRFAILDVWEGIDFGTSDYSPIEKFRNGIGDNFLSFGAAYFPWLETSIVSDSEISWENIKNWENWIKKIGENFKNEDALQSKLKAIIDIYFTDKIKTVEIDGEIDDEGKTKTRPLTADELFNLKNSLHLSLVQNWEGYGIIFETIKNRINLLPPSAAIAGIYNTVDNTKGVWKAPANISINSVVKPSVNITHEEQEDLNIPMNGKAINAIRFFVGEGINIWGARTLDGNSLDWRYINVRRTIIFIEESVKNAVSAYVFEPNNAVTWVNIKGMIGNFLRAVWKRGGLAGSSPEDAYSVHIGLGDTMTPEDILEGILRVTVLVAISRPAEFIEITFQQQMQKS